MSTRCAIRTPSRAVYCHFDGYPEAVLPALARMVQAFGPEAGLAHVMEFDWEVLADVPGDYPAPVIPDRQVLPLDVKWVYDVTHSGVRWFHPCDLPVRADCDCELEYDEGEASWDALIVASGLERS